MEGISDNITVRSIVGRFLEHTRIYEFNFGGQRRIYMGSADLMQRNLNRRVELLFPVEESSMQEYVASVLDLMLRDNMKGRILLPDGIYVRLLPKKDESPFNCQQHFLQLAHARQMKIDTISAKSNID